MENEYLSKGEDFEIQPRLIEFRMEGAWKKGSLLINISIKNMIIEWYFFLFLPYFIFVASEVRVDYSHDENPYICMFIPLFFISIFNE
jgi:hypothetical protein